jgi:uncharacterized membrane protein YjjP (DUF1212 family)
MQLVRRFLLYASLSVLLALGFLGASFVVLNRWGHDDFIRWGGFTGFTLGLFGLFIGESDKHFKQWQFWVLTAVLLAIHLAVYSAILLHAEEWKLTWFMGMAFEYPVFLYLRNMFAASL